VAPPTRTTVEIGELPPGGRIAVELKVIAVLRAGGPAAPAAPKKEKEGGFVRNPAGGDQC